MTGRVARATDGPSGPGDKRALGVLLATQAPRARRQFAAAAAAAGIADELDDIVADALTQLVVRTSGRGSLPSDVDGFIDRAVRRRLAREQRRRRHEIPMPAPRAVLGRQDDPPDPLDGLLAVRALQGLPQRWQQVLWEAEVVRMPHRTIAEGAGSNPNAVAATAFRAREALRIAYLGCHMGAPPAARACRTVRPWLPAAARGSLGPNRLRKVAAHVVTCHSCRATLAELARLAAAFPPLAPDHRKSSATAAGSGARALDGLDVERDRGDAE